MPPQEMIYNVFAQITATEEPGTARYELAQKIVGFHASQLRLRKKLNGPPRAEETPVRLTRVLPKHRRMDFTQEDFR